MTPYEGLDAADIFTIAILYAYWLPVVYSRGNESIHHHSIDRVDEGARGRIDVATQALRARAKTVARNGSRTPPSQFYCT